MTIIKVMHIKRIIFIQKTHTMQFDLFYYKLYLCLCVASSPFNVRNRPPYCVGLERVVAMQPQVVSVW